MLAFVACVALGFTNGHAQILPTPAPSALPSSPPSQVTAPSSSPAASPTPTRPPITVQPQSAQVPVGATQQLSVGGTIGTLSAVARDPSIVDVGINQATLVLTLAGKAPGQTVVTLTDARGVTLEVPVTVAFNAGVVPSKVVIRITGDPASVAYVRREVVRAIRRAVVLRPDAQAIVTRDDVPFDGQLDQDNNIDLSVPVLIQGESDFSVNGTTDVLVENVAAPRIAPDSLMVSDYPERLTENGILFTSDLRSDAPSRFLSFHYNPPGQAARRIVLRAQNLSPEPATLQFIFGRSQPDPNEMEAGHEATKAFLVHIVQNEGRLITIGGDRSMNLIEANMPPGTILTELMQLRVLEGGSVHLTLFAQNQSDDPNAPIAPSALLSGRSNHARGVYRIPEFHYATQWDVTGPYLELPIGEIPLPNMLRGRALSGDYGVLEDFTVNIQNPLTTPQQIAIYENPRGGSATASYLIDGVLVQSHQVPAFSRYKVRQYVIPARGFVRVTIITMPEGGSSYPLKLIFAPDDGSVAPGAPGSPIY